MSRKVQPVVRPPLLFIFIFFIDINQAFDLFVYRNINAIAVNSALIIINI